MHPFFGCTVDDHMWMYMCPGNEGLQDRRMRPAVEDLKKLGCEKVLVFAAEKDHLFEPGRNYVRELKKSGWGGESELVENWGCEHCFHIFGNDREGYALDRFAEGLWALQPVHQNRIGLVLDAGIEKELQIRHLQVADAARASLGLNVVEYIVTDTPLKVEKWIDPESGQSTGRIKHPGSLLRAVETLVNQSTVNAIAVVGRFPDDDIEEGADYRLGMGIDNLAGVEAVISHLVVRTFKIPCAHAPALSPFPLSPSLSPKSAAEELGYTFLPCVLAGLSTAPQYLVKNSESMERDCILASDVDSVILPKDACRGDGALAFARSGKNKPLIITVEENETVLNDTPDKLGFEALKVSNYWEAIGVIAAHKAGVDPFSLRRDQIFNIPCKSVPVNGNSVSRERT